MNGNANKRTLLAHFNRVGVTNAADRGLDLYANFGSVVQVKHLALDIDLAEGIVGSVTSDRIIIVCKSAEKALITSVLNQLGWTSRIQAVVTIDDLVEWYELALRGKFSNVLAERILLTLSEEIKNEFPSVGNSDFQTFCTERGYDKLKSISWGKLT